MDEQLLAFIEFGIWANIIIMVASFVLTIMKVATFSDDEMKKVIAFSAVRSEYIVNFNSTPKRILAFLLNALPMYPAILNAWYLIIMLTTPGPRGVINGTIASDNLSLIQLAHYEVKSLEDK